MRIAFKQPSQQMPLFCESIGYQWQQPPIKRPKATTSFTGCKPKPVQASSL